MNQIAQQIAARTGINEAQVRQAIEHVIEGLTLRLSARKDTSFEVGRINADVQPGPQPPVEDGAGRTGITAAARK